MMKIIVLQGRTKVELGTEMVQSLERLSNDGFTIAKVDHSISKCSRQYPPNELTLLAVVSVQ